MTLFPWENNWVNMSSFFHSSIHIQYIGVALPNCHLTRFHVISNKLTPISKSYLWNTFSDTLMKWICMCSTYKWKSIHTIYRNYRYGYIASPMTPPLVDSTAGNCMLGALSCEGHEFNFWPRHYLPRQLFSLSQIHKSSVSKEYKFKYCFRRSCNITFH